MAWKVFALNFGTFTYRTETSLVKNFHYHMWPKMLVRKFRNWMTYRGGSLSLIKGSENKAGIFVLDGLYLQYLLRRYSTWQEYVPPVCIATAFSSLPGWKFCFVFFFFLPHLLVPRTTLSITSVLLLLLSVCWRYFFEPNHSLILLLISC